jgi:hypothetical protein
MSVERNVSGCHRPVWWNCAGLDVMVKDVVRRAAPAFGSP